MGITYDYVLPKAAASGDGESLLTEAQIADELLARLGQVTPEYPNGKTETVARLEVQSIAVGAGSKPVASVDRVLKKLKEESAALRTVNPTTYTKLSEYEAELAKKSELIAPTKWTAAMKAAYGVTTFDALKAKIVTEEGALETGKALAELGV